MTRINMTIFKTALKAVALKKMLLDNQYIRANYEIIEDISKNGLFAVQNYDNPKEIYTLGIKNNTIWTSGFTFFIESMLIQEQIPYTKDHYPFDDSKEARTIFSQKYLI